MKLRIDQFAYMITAAHLIYSPGLDNIPRWFYHNCSYEIAHVVAHILNLSFSCGTVPKHPACKKNLASANPKSFSLGEPHLTWCDLMKNRPIGHKLKMYVYIQ